MHSLHMLSGGANFRSRCKKYPPHFHRFVGEDVTKMNVLNLLLSSGYLYASSESVIWALTTDDC